MGRKLLALFLGVAWVQACSWDHLIWIPRGRTADALYRFVKDGKAGYIDGAGKIVIGATLPVYGNSGSAFHDGLLEVGASDGKYMDRSGKVVIDIGLDRGWDFSEGLAVAMRKGERLWGYINTKGAFAISPRFQTFPRGYVYPFSDGLAMIEEKGKFGYIDRTGEFVIPPRFLDGSGFQDGAARVVVDGPCYYFPDNPCGMMNTTYPGGKGTNVPACKFRYVDKRGRFIGNGEFDFGRDFSEGMAPVRVGELWGYIDTSGSMVISPRFADAWPFASGLALIKQEGQFGYADKSGNVVISTRLGYAEGFSEGLAVVGDGLRTYWYIDASGKQAIAGNFGAASPFFKGLAHVQLDAIYSGGGELRYAYIDKTGKQVFNYTKCYGAGC